MERLELWDVGMQSRVYQVRLKLGINEMAAFLLYIFTNFEKRSDSSTFFSHEKLEMLKRKS